MLNDNEFFLWTPLEKQQELYIEESLKKEADEMVNAEAVFGEDEETDINDYSNSNNFLVSQAT